MTVTDDNRLEPRVDGRIDARLGRRVDAALQKQVMSAFCTGVTIVTALKGDAPVGFTCQSFSSLSLDPPYVALFPATSSTSWPRIRAAGRFVVNILASDQKALASAFAVSGGDKFAGVAWTAAPNAGGPVLDGALSWIECELEQEVPGGDHTIAIGRILALGGPAGDFEGDREPLLFWERKFGTFAN